MSSLSHLVGGREYTVYGANVDLIKWLRDSRLGSAGLDGARVKEDDLFVAFGARLDAERVSASKKIIHKLWSAHRALGPYPFLDTLSEFEFDRMFHANYRDHVCHQLKVFLLGLMVYEGCTPLRTAVDETLRGPAGDAKNPFLLQWLVTAVYHDIGYVLENEQGNDRTGRAWQKTLAKLNEVFGAPLSFIPSVHIDAYVERRVINDREITIKTVQAPPDLEQYGNQDFFELLREEGERARVAAKGSTSPPLRVYYEYAFSHAGEGRPRFRDHGIVSALLLLRTWHAWARYLHKLKQYLDDPHLQDVRKPLAELDSAVDSYGEAIRAAAGAMALHNIDKKLWDKIDTLSHGLSLPDFSIRLFDHERRLPLAFLLGLVDTLQGWDRPRFRDGSDEIDIDQDLSIQVKGDRIALHISKDAQRFRSPQSDPLSAYSKTVASMKEYLEPDAVEALVTWDAGENAAPAGLAADAAPRAAPSAERTRLFNTYVHRFHAMQGVGEMDVEAQRRSYRTYRFLVRNDQVQRVELINGRGTLVENESGVAVWEHRYDQRGRLIDMSEFSRAQRLVRRIVYSPNLEHENFRDRHDRPLKLPRTEVTDRHHELDAKGFSKLVINLNAWGAPRPNEDGEVALSYERNEFGQPLRVLVVNPDKKPSSTRDGHHGADWGYDSLGNAIRFRLFDSNLTAFVCKDGFGAWQSKTDPFGNIIETTYLDADKKPTWHVDGYAMRRWVHDEWGNCIELSFYGVEGELALDKSGIAGATLECDERGNVVLYKFFGADRLPVLHTDWVAGWRSEFDDKDREVKRRYFGADEKPTLRKDGVAGWRVKYDERGNQIESSYFGIDGAPVLDKEGVAGWHSEFDSKDREIARRHIGVDKQPVLSKEGIAGWRTRFDERGNQIEYVFLGVDGSPTLRKEGFSRWTSQFDDAGNETGRQYFGIEGQPAVHPDGFAGWNAKFDERGNRVEVTALDADGRPTPHKDGWAGHRTRFDDRGNVTGEIFVDAQGRPTLQREGVAGWHAVFDDRGREVSRRFVGTDGEAVLYKDGFTSSKTVYDDRGRPIKVSYWGKGGEPALDKDGVSSWEATFDSRGQEIQRRFFGTDGKPTINRKGYASVQSRFDARGNRIESANYGVSGERVLHHDGNAILRTRYDARGNAIEQSYFGTNEKPILHKDGFATEHLIYDDRGRIVERRYLGAAGEPVLHKDGFSRVNTVFDDRGRLIRQSYLGESAEPALQKDGIAGWESVFDVRGNEIERSYLGIDGKPVLNKDGIARAPQVRRPQQPNRDRLQRRAGRADLTPRRIRHLAHQIRRARRRPRAGLFWHRRTTHPQ